MKMEYTPLGSTNLQISRIGFGCAAIGGYDYGRVDDDASIAAIHRAIDLGVNFFDTADIYGLGHSEEILGRAIHSCKHDVIVATKGGIRWNNKGVIQRDNSAQWLEKAIEDSLRRLQVDSISLYQIHWPDLNTPISETMEVLERCQRNGKIRFIGCCNFPIELLHEGQKHIRLESLQIPYSLAEQENRQLIELSHNTYSMTPLAYNVLAQGLFTGKYDQRSEFSGSDLRLRSLLFKNIDNNLKKLKKLKDIAELYHKTPAQTAIRWALDSTNVGCALTGAKTSKQIEENIKAIGWTLSENDLKLLSEEP